jgi:hypothetical protein
MDHTHTHTHMVPKLRFIRKLINLGLERKNAILASSGDFCGRSNHSTIIYAQPPLEQTLGTQQEGGGTTGVAACISIVCQ